MNGIDVFVRCGLNDVIHIQIAFAAQSGANVNRLIGVFDVQGICIRVRKDSDGFDSHFPAGPHDPDGNFSPVGDQNFLKFSGCHSKPRAEQWKNL